MKERCRHFKEDFLFEICTTITASQYTEFEKVVEEAKRVEHSISEGHKVQALK